MPRRTGPEGPAVARPHRARVERACLTFWTADMGGDHTRPRGVHNLAANCWYRHADGQCVWTRWRYHILDWLWVGSPLLGRGTWIAIVSGGSRCF